MLSLYITYKNIDLYYSCSFGTNIDSGANFATPPILPHGPAEIIVGHDVKVCENTVIL